MEQSTEEEVELPEGHDGIATGLRPSTLAQFGPASIASPMSVPSRLSYFASNRS